MIGRSSAAPRWSQLAGNPPWQPAQDPSAPPVSSPSTVLPAQVITPEQPEKPLAPWEQSPEKFAVAPHIGEPPWSPVVLSAEVVVPEQYDKSLPPWEQSPEEFAVAPPAEEAPWPIANTGPLYVWNPPQATGPIIVVRDEDR